MKKIFSLFAAVLFAGSMMADSYVKVTEAPTDWAGDYLIVYEAGNVAFDGSLTTLDAVSNNVAVTISEGAIAATEALNAAKFTIAKVDGGYSLQAASGKFIGVTSNSNGLKQADEVGDYTHDLSIDESGNAVIKANFEGSTMTLRYNKASNQARFRYYKSGQEAIALYKFVAGGDTPEPASCKWDELDWIGDGSPEQTFGSQFKVCKEGEQPGVVNIQKPGFADESGIYMTFPSAAFGEISLAASKYAVQGAGIVFYCSAFTAKETEVTVNCDNKAIVFTVYNDKGGSIQPEVIAAPVFAPATTEFEEKVEVSITCATQEVKIYYTLDGSEPTAAATEYTAAFELNATTTVKAIAIKGENKSEIVSKTYTKVELPKNLGEKTIAEFLELKNTKDTCILSGVVDNITNTTYGNFDLLEIGNPEIKVYIYGLLNAAGESKKFAELGVAEGDTVTLKAIYSEYNGKAQVKNAIFVSVKKSSAPIVEPENLGEKTIAEFLQLQNKKDTCVLTGKVIDIANAEFGNLTIEDATGSLYVYGVLTPAGESKKFAELDVAVNDVLTIKAIYNEYNGNPQAKNAIFVSREKATPSAIDNTTVAGKAQKMIIDGQLFILRDGVLYNANGAAVK